MTRASRMPAKCSRNFSTRPWAWRWPDPARTAAMARNPAGGIGLRQGVARRRVGAVDRADVVQAEEPALEDVLVAGVLAVDPPGEVDQELVEDPAEEVDVDAAGGGAEP